MATLIDQQALWNGPAGKAWVDEQHMLDEMFAPFAHRLVERISGTRVLDVGCGTGGVTIAAARRLGSGGRCVGVDISEPMLASARARADVPVTFVCADAQSYAFEPATFDTVISRFGVMFFDDSVRAFANLHGAVKPGGTLHVIAWRSADENPFMTTAERAAAPLLPNMPDRRGDGPGQFAFADPNKVRAILTQSGWTELSIEPLDVVCTFPARDLDRYITRLGPVGVLLADAPQALREQVMQTVRSAFAPYVDGEQVRYTAACWDATARA